MLENIKKIEINGNERVSDQTIKIYGDIKINEDVNEQKLNQILKICMKLLSLKTSKFKLKKIY